MNKEFALDRYYLSQADTVSSLTCLINKGMAWESFSKMANGAAAEQSSIVPQMLKTAGQPSLDMITSLLNLIIVEGVILVEWELL